MLPKRKYEPAHGSVSSNFEPSYDHNQKRVRKKETSASPGDLVSSVTSSSPLTSTECDTDFFVSDESLDDESAFTTKKAAHKQTHKTARPQTRTSRRLSLRIGRNYRVATDINGCYLDGESNISRRTQQTAIRSISVKKKRNMLAAELANLADFNRPPETFSRIQSGRETNPKTRSYHGTTGTGGYRKSMRIPKVTNLSDQHRVHGARITKPIIKAPIVKKQCHEDRLLIEVKQLQSWHGRISDADEEDDSSDSHVENDRVPRSHARQYPPIVPGTQNTPWLELPGEIRNKIYEYAILAEEQKTVNIVHYPNGIPRRSIRGIASRTNFAHSAWGFTQSCRQVREEFTPWLLEKRRIRTPLATLNNYVDTFHPLNQNGKRIGWIEPICSNAPLPHDGVEILKLLQCKHNNTSFHLQLTPTTPTNMGHDLLALPTDPDQFDEIRILRDMGESFETWSGIILQSSGIDGIHIMSIVEQGNIDAEGVKDSEDDDESHDILIKLDVNQSKQSTITSQDRLRHIGRFIFNSQLDQLHGLRLQSSFDCGIARWRVTRAGTVDMQWNARKSRSKKIFRRLTNAPHEPEGFAESNLD